MIRAKGRVAVAACIKEGGKRLIWDENAKIAALTTGWMYAAV